MAATGLEPILDKLKETGMDSLFENRNALVYVVFRDMERAGIGGRSEALKTYGDHCRADRELRLLFMNRRERCLTTHQNSWV